MRPSGLIEKRSFFLARFSACTGLQRDCLDRMTLDHVWFADEPRREIYVPDQSRGSCGRVVYLDDRAFRYLEAFLTLLLEEAPATPTTPLLYHQAEDTCRR